MAVDLQSPIFIIQKYARVNLKVYLNISA